jgi:predicted ribosomally synthesized peptide with SipW-like signal peptide
MTDKKYELSRRKALLGLGTIGVAGAAAGMGTSALFSDEETFEDNTIQAGTTNLIVEATVAEYDSTANLFDDSTPGYVEIEDADGEVDGDAGVGITATDLKPGDAFVVGFNVIVEDNPMYVAAQASNLADSENTPNTEPENATSTDPDTGGDAVGSGAGDLDNQMETVIGYDGPSGGADANNFTWDQSGAVAPNNAEAGTGGGQSLTAYLDNLANQGFLYRNPDPGPTPLGHGNGNPTELGNGDNVTHWQYFEIPIGVGNEIQGDSVSWDVTWYAEQVRNNAAPSGPSDVVDGSPN